MKAWKHGVIPLGVIPLWEAPLMKGMELSPYGKHGVILIWKHGVPMEVWSYPLMGSMEFPYEVWSYPLMGSMELSSYGKHGVILIWKHGVPLLELSSYGVDTLSTPHERKSPSIKDKRVSMCKCTKQ